MLRDLRASGQQLPVIVLDRARRHPRPRRRAGCGRRRLPGEAVPLRGARRPGPRPAPRREAGPQRAAQLRVGDVVLDLRTGGRASTASRSSSAPASSSSCGPSSSTPTRCCRREQLLARVWGYDYDPGSNVVDVYVGYLRRKLGSRALRDRPRRRLPLPALASWLRPGRADSRTPRTRSRSVRACAVADRPRRRTRRELFSHAKRCGGRRRGCPRGLGRCSRRSAD